MLVWLASYPRSGNTLTVVTLHDALGVREIGSIWDDDLLLGRVLQKLVSGPAWTAPAELRGLGKDDLLEALHERPEPYFIRTHRLSEVPAPGPALYIVRDGRDAIVSHAHYVAAQDVPRFRGQSFDRRVARLIRPGVRAYGHWSRNVDRWRGRRAPVAMIRFEELVHDPVAVVRAGLEELGLSPGPVSGEAPSFERLRGRAPDLFRRGVVGSWRDEMSPRLQERFWRVHGAQMRALGYD